MIHDLALRIDYLGFDYAECGCGWISPPCPDKGTAAEFYAEHLSCVED